jgi:AcrR family transcriptional regulator
MARQLKRVEARYHHGNLREALIEATLRLIEEGGPDQVTVREAARRAKVSSAAPFRHFPTRTALMTAVAEEAHRRLRDEIDMALESAPSEDPLARLIALGTAYLQWAVRNPTHFEVVSARRLIDYDGSDYLRQDNEALRALMETLLREAVQRGQLAIRDIARTVLEARALVYGLARMYVDGHFAQWGIPGEAAEASMRRVLLMFIASLAAPGAADQPCAARTLSGGEPGESPSIRGSRRRKAIS